jgi:Flp pilus assembly CpaE family ATPase
MPEGIKALIIDEDETSRNLLVSLLNKRGCAVRFSTTGRDGLQKAHDNAPNIIICDTNLSDLGIPELIEKLGSVTLTAFIPIVAISGRSDANEMERCLKAGCVEYYGKSGLNLIALVEAMPRIIGTASVKGNIIASDGLLTVFLSAKGGSGTSSLCANIGACLAKNMAPSKVALADLVLPMGSIASIVGYEGAFDIVDVADLPAQEVTSNYLIKNLIVQPTWSFYLLPGSPDPERAGNLNIKQIPDIVNALIKAFDYTLIDFGRALSKISIPIIQKADAVVIVMGTDLSAVRLTKKLCQFLQSQEIEQEHIFLILNRAVGLEGVSKIEAEKIIGLPIRMTVPYMMSNFTLANNQNIPVPVKYPTDTVTMMLNQATNEISSLAIKEHKVKK